MASNNINIDENIFRDLQRFYGCIFNLPPLAARIYAYLMFDFEKKGLTFEDFVEVFSVSKSSVSENINLLLKLNLIKNSELYNERKRHFIINGDFVKIRFQEIVEKMQSEIEILDRLHGYRNSRDENLNEKYSIYRSLLSKNIENIQDSLRKLYNETRCAFRN